MRLRHAYFKHWINWMELTLYFCTLNFVWVYSNPCLCPHERQWEFGSISVFLGWIILTLFVDKLPGTGIYVVMFISIFKTFVKTIILSLLLIISFGLAFYMLFHLPDMMVEYIYILPSCFWIHYIYWCMYSKCLLICPSPTYSKLHLAPQHEHWSKQWPWLQGNLTLTLPFVNLLKIWVYQI